MNPRILVPLVFLAGCAPGRALNPIAEADLDIALTTDTVKGEVVVRWERLSAEILEDEIVEFREDQNWPREGLRIEVVLSEADSGRVQVEPLVDEVEVHEWRRNGPLSAGRSDAFTRQTSRDKALWSERFLLVRYLEEGECEAEESCEIRLPIQLDQRRGEAQALRAQVRFGTYEPAYSNTRIEQEAERGIEFSVDWEPES